MAVTLSDVKVSILPGGLRLISGIGTLDSSYVDTGEVMDLSSYMKSADVPHVTLSGGAGYLLEHDGGTAAAGVIKAYISNNAAVMKAAANTTNLVTITFRFLAVGDAY